MTQEDQIRPVVAIKQYRTLDGELWESYEEAMAHHRKTVVDTKLQEWAEKYADKEITHGQTGSGHVQEALESGWPELLEILQKKAVQSARKPPAPVEMLSVARSEERRVGKECRLRADDTLSLHDALPIFERIHSVLIHHSCYMCFIR